MSSQFLGLPCPPDCEVNDFAYPMRTEHNRLLARAVEIMCDFWSAWDEDTEPSKRIHLAVLDIPLYVDMLQKGRAAGFS